MTGPDLHLRLDAYLAVRAALGFRSMAEKTLLRDFVKWLEAKGMPDPIRAQDALEWATAGSIARGLSGQAARLSMARGFLSHLRASLPETEVPDRQLLLRPRRSKPYIFTESEIELIMKSAAQSKAPQGSLRSTVRATLVGLLATTGLRVGEAIRLNMSDVILDSEPPHLVVRETKFRKTRIVPLHPSAAASLHDYVAARRHLGHDGLSDSFFVSDNGRALCGTSVWLWFQRLTKRLGIEARAGSRRPCLQCLRHYFATTRLRTWYEDGLNVAEMLPHLSVYLGHVRPSDTFWYLTATPELMGSVADRFLAYAGGER